MQGSTKKSSVDIFKTIYFDLIQVLFSAIGVLLYTKYESDLKQSRNPLTEILYMHMSFITNVKTTYIIALIFLVIDSIFIQTFF